MNFTIIILLLLFQNSFYENDSNNFRFPFYQRDFIEVNKFYGKQRMKRFLPIHVNPIDYLGINYEVKIDAPALSISSGKIEKIHNSKGFGNYVLINHGNGFKARYYHLKETKVSLGDLVIKGEQIGISGNTGLTIVNSIGLAIYSNDKKVNPELFLKQDSKSLENKN